MGLLSNIKDKVVREAKAMKYNRDLENDPVVVRNRLDMERVKIKEEKKALLERQAFEKDKAELKELKNSTGLRGSIREGFKGLQSHLSSVRERNAKAELKSTTKVINPLKESRFGNSESIVSGNKVNLYELKGMHNLDSGKPRGGLLNDNGPARKSDFATGGVLGQQEVVPKKKKSSGKTIIIVR